jgi:trans-aconitate 2-methyltransferase
VEPDDVYRQQAVARLQAFSADPVPAWPALPPHLDACFDLILSNHVFYYVPDLEDTLSAVLSSLSPSGLFLASMAGLSNTMVQFCIRCFGLIGKPYPFRTSEDFEVAMDRLGRSCAREDIHYELVFPDSEENRLEIARFLMGSDYPAVPTQVMVDLFAPYSSGGRIAMQLVHKHFAVGDWGSAEMPATVAGRQ